jgi:hypothetical protein
MKLESTEYEEEDGVMNGITGPRTAVRKKWNREKQIQPSDTLFFFLILMPTFGLNEFLPRHQATKSDNFPVGLYCLKYRLL